YRELLGLEPMGPPAEMPAQGVRLVFLATGPEPAARIELIQPTMPGNGVARFLEARGEGLHHVCLRSRDLATDLSALAAAEAELIDTQPRPGADGRVAFGHPRTLSGVLREVLDTS